MPSQCIPACEKGFKESLTKGPLLEFPVTGIKVTITDGAFHSVDSSEKAFYTASRDAFRMAYMKAKPVIHEPIMKIEIETPNEYQGACMALINQRRGIILGSQDEGIISIIDAQAPLSEMFGFSTALRYDLPRGKHNLPWNLIIIKRSPMPYMKKL